MLTQNKDFEVVVEVRGTDEAKKINGGGRDEKTEEIIDHRQNSKKLEMIKFQPVLQSTSGILGASEVFTPYALLERSIMVLISPFLMRSG